MLTVPPDAYNVTLTVTDDDGASGSVTPPGYRDAASATGQQSAACGVRGSVHRDDLRLPGSQHR